VGIIAVYFDVIN